MKSFAKTNTREIYYRDRQTGEILRENNASAKILRFFYEDAWGFPIFRYLLNNQVFCWLYGKYQDSPLSRSKINNFVTHHNINVAEIELPLDNYRSFNEFFSRRLKPQTRPFINNPDVFCSPCDGKVLVYPRLTDKTSIPVKGAWLSLESLLSSKTISQTYEHGSALIVRLAPYDYHRFHFPVDGEASCARKIQGEYHSVHPIALNKVANIFCRNQRSVTELFSPNFGKIADIEVGAITIGSIVQTYQPGIITKGQEKGYFQYGGSTIILIFEPNAIAFDEDLIRDSAQNLEVQVLAGSQIGRKFKES